MTYFRGGLLTLACLLLLPISVNIALAETTKYGGSYFYLAPNGNDNNDGRTPAAPVKTFWHAQYLLGPGDVLLVRGGAYSDQLFVTLTSGTPSKPITVQAYPGEKPVIGGHSMWGAFVIVTNPYWIFDGLSYEGMVDGNYVYWIHDTHHITLRNLSMKNFAGDMLLMAGCQDMVVENSYFDTSGSPDGWGEGEHIWIAGSKRVLVQNSKFIRAGHASISIIDDNRNGGTSANNVIRNNVIEQHWGGGIYVGNYSRANVIEGNQISYAGEQDPYTKLGIGISCPENIVRKNVISRTGSSLQPLDNGLGIYAWDDGAKRQNAVDNRLYNNVVYRSANRGLYFYLRGESQASRNKFVNNVFYHNREQRCDPWGCGPGLEISIDSFHTDNKWPFFPNQNYFVNNVILGAVDSADQPGGLSVSYDYEDWSKSVNQLQADYPNYFRGNSDVAPRFTDAEVGLFTLQPGSKLIDGGADLTRTAGAASNTTTVTVEDARFFTDGYGVVAGDAVSIGSNQPVTILGIDYASNTLTVDRAVSFAAGDAVNLPFSGAKPDVGAFEYSQSSMVAISGTPQNTASGSAFAAPLSVRVTDSAAKPVPGIMVTFTAPASGATATFNGAPTATAFTDSNGIASSPLPAAGATAGAFTISASAAGYPAVAFTLTNTAAQAASSDATLFGNAPVNAPFFLDYSPVELGVKFRSDVSGFVIGVRFYKNPADNAPHTGSLWSATGALLATGTFTNETPSGWQQLNFSSPVPISPMTTYVVSYHTNVGLYATRFFFTATGTDSGLLHALKSGVDGPNSVFKYGNGNAFVTDSYQDSNYWVDVVFSPGFRLGKR